MADELLRVLVIGVGSIGERHLRCFGQTERCRVSLCEVNPTLRDEIGKRYHVERCFPDVGAALAQSHDAAVVAVPAHLHVPIARQAVEAGVHVLIEKPLSVTMDGVDELRQAVEERARVAAVAYVQRAHPALAAMKDAIAEDRFGRPLQLVAVSGQHFPKYRPAYVDTYYADRATGGGAIQDAITHLFDAGQWLVGPMDRLVADADHQALFGTTVEDAVHVVARHGVVMAAYALNQFQPHNEKTITVVCQRGTARFEYHRNRWRWMTEPDEPWHDEPVPILDRDTLFVRQADNFLDAVEGKSEPLCSLQDGILSLGANLAALASVESQEWVAVPRAGAVGNPSGRESMTANEISP